MERDAIRIQRRAFLKLGSIAVASLAVAARAGEALAQARVDEKDPAAAALGYRHDAAKTDTAKYKNYAAGQTCANCVLYQGKPGEAWGPCQIFPGKQVAARGWCSAYQIDA